MKSKKDKDSKKKLVLKRLRAYCSAICIVKNTMLIASTCGNMSNVNVLTKAYEKKKNTNSQTIQTATCCMLGLHRI